MSIPVPQYIRDLATDIVCEKETLSCKIKCSCGCTAFTVYKNIIEKSPELLAGDRAFKEFVRRNRHRKYFCNFEGENAIFYRKNIFGKKTDITVVPAEVVMGDNSEVFKIKCQDCQKEYVLFDSRKHGYDGAFCAQEDKWSQKYSNVEYTFSQLDFEKDSNSVVEITYTVMNDESLEIFMENTGIETDEDGYSNGFSWLTITGKLLDKKGKEVEICDIELA